MKKALQLFWSKLNVPQAEVDAFTDRIKERKMGELFKHFQGWDVQALRREIAEAKEEAEKAREKAEKAREKAEKEQEAGIQKLFNVLKKFHMSREDAVTQLMEEYQLSADEAREKAVLYW